MESSKPLIILGSARRDSDTRKLAGEILAGTGYVPIDLLDYRIYPYDYAACYPADDQFLTLVPYLIKHEVLIFATPVYWYAMSGLMKTFFDRFTDLVTVRKDLGRQLKGKKMFLIAVGSDNKLPEGFETPFQLTARYMDMVYVSAFYCACSRLVTVLPETSDIREKIQNCLSLNNRP